MAARLHEASSQLGRQQYPSSSAISSDNNNYLIETQHGDLYIVSMAFVIIAILKAPVDSTDHVFCCGETRFLYLQ